MNIKKIVALFVTIATIVGLFSCVPFAASAEGELKWSVSFSKLNGDVFEPVTAVTASALILGQTFHKTEVLGIACILGGIAILTIAKGEGS